MQSAPVRRPVAEIGVCTLVILVCIIVLWQASSLPPGSFEPLGSAPVPQATACIVILCCLIVIAGAVRRMRQPVEETTGDQTTGDQTAPQTVPQTVPMSSAFKHHVKDEFVGRSPYGALVMLGATIAYTALLHSRLIPFGVLTFVFLLLVIWALNNFKRRSLLPAALTAIVFGFGTQFIFTKVFIIDLPV